MTSTSEIRRAVLEVVSSLVHRPSDDIPLSARLVKDLKIASDDLTFILVPDLEQRLGIAVPLADWRSVYTVQDVIDALEKSAQGDDPA